MKNLLLLLFLVYAHCLFGQLFTQSNLPIIIIDTEGKPIFDEPKTAANMKILYNSGSNNIIGQDSSHFDGLIGIELRGQSSQSFPKKGYGIETRDELGEDKNEELLDMPSESDWVIHSPYSDKSLIRNALTYQLAGEIMAYAPRVKLAELVLNDNYEGVVLWTEKIKRDKDRVDVNKLNPDENEGDDLTGGYIIRFDKSTSFEEAWESPYDPIPGTSAKTRFIYHYPKASNITPQQDNYIEEYVTNFENVLMSDDFEDPTNGWRKYADASSFVQLMIINELSRNVDGYRLSTYMYKDKDSDGGKLTMGPVWDYNLAFGNADYCSGSNISGWAYNFNDVCPGDFWVNHVWWKRLMQDNAFRQELKDTWQDLRSGVFSDDALLLRIDSLTTELSSAQQRNFTRWRVLGTYIWPNEFVGVSYNQEIDYLKDWITRRTSWLDNNIRALTTPTEEVNLSRAKVFPNPSADIARFDLSEFSLQPDLIELYNDEGKLLSNRIIDRSEIEISLAQYPGNKLFYRLLRKGQLLETNQILLIR